MADDYRQRNVAAQDGDPASILNFYRALAALRRSEPALNRGEYEEVELGVPDVLAYRRTWAGSDGFWVVLNFGQEAAILDLQPIGSPVTMNLALSTDASRDDTPSGRYFTLAGNEGAIFRLAAA